MLVSATTPGWVVDDERRSGREEAAPGLSWTWVLGLVRLSFLLLLLLLLAALLALATASERGVFVQCDGEAPEGDEGDKDGGDLWGVTLLLLFCCCFLV